MRDLWSILVDREYRTVASFIAIITTCIGLRTVPVDYVPGYSNAIREVLPVFMILVIVYFALLQKLVQPVILRSKGLRALLEAEISLRASWPSSVYLLLIVPCFVKYLYSLLFLCTVHNLEYWETYHSSPSSIVAIIDTLLLLSEEEQEEEQQNNRKKKEKARVVILVAAAPAPAQKRQQQQQEK